MTGAYVIGTEMAAGYEPPSGSLNPAAFVRPDPTSRPLSELSDSGLLWLINATVFHPRGFALALDMTPDGEVTGWALLGNGTEPWVFGGPRNERFAAAEATFEEARGAVP
jgi:hypothetical protein